MTDEMKNYLQLWKDNYYGRSDEALELLDLVKENYKKNKYIPWATMERLMLFQDPTADVEVIHPNNNHDLDFPVFHGQYDMNQTVNGTETKVTKHTYMIKLKITFMGVSKTAWYPIMDKSYDAPNAIDSNMVNKSIQRATAKIISKVTGLGYGLYEKGDLQFEDNVEPSITSVEDLVGKDRSEESTPEAPTKSKKVSKKGKEPLKEITPLEALCQYIIDNYDSITPKIKGLNTSLITKYSVSIDKKDTLEVLMDKLSVIANPEQTLNVLRTTK